MDQSKWALPRVRHGVVTKSLAKKERVRAKIQGVWLHNICLCLYCLDVRQSADASMVIECMCRALEQMSTICERMRVATPKKILLWVSWMQYYP